MRADHIETSGSTCTMPLDPPLEPPQQTPPVTLYTRDDLKVFNLLKQPIWVFDIEFKRMWWANNSALDIWNAATLEELLTRDLSNEMSEATLSRLAEFLVRFQVGEEPVEEWTYYPAEKISTAVEVRVSRIRVEGGKLLMLNEGRVLTDKDIDHQSLLGVEILRHLPIAVSQSDIDGNIMYQNPEALETFGSCIPTSRKRVFSGTMKETQEINFRRRFLDQDLAQQVFDEVKKGNDCSVEAQLYTKQGPRWSSVNAHQTRDPVSGQPSILYSTRDITDLVEARKDAAKANATKTEFFSVMAHEIRTPLHQVSGFVDLLSKTDLNKDQRGYMSLLQVSCDSLMAVINSSLDYMKLEAGKLDLETIPFEPKAIVECCVESIASQVEKKGISITTSCADGLPVRMVGDPNRLRQILLKLLKNAVKFTSKGSIKVTLSSKSTSEGQVALRFTVEDTGVGIKKSRQALIFGNGNGTKASPDPNDGVHLGLRICDRLVQAMKGSIGVESEVDKGSTFWFEIPCATAMVLFRQDHSSETDNHPVGLNVLVAEDNKVNQKVVTAMLNRLGHTVTVAENGVQAVERLQSTKYDLVLMDIQMPVLDGIEATKEIRSRGWKCPIVGLTASYQLSKQDFYHQIGMTDCVSKPISMKGLRSTISQHVRTTKVNGRNGLGCIHCT